MGLEAEISNRFAPRRASDIVDLATLALAVANLVASVIQVLRVAGADPIIAIQTG
jgi:hypothetical protein